MLKIAICDDEQPIREYLKKLAENTIPSQTYLYSCGEEILNSNMDFDLILLDISMNTNQTQQTLNGVETARKIRAKWDGIIIFITALKEYVFEGYDVGAFHYLLKPVDENKFAEVINQAARQIEKTRRTDSIVIKINGIYKQIATKNIIYAENDARKIVLHTKTSNYTFYEKMEVMEQKLGADFFRSHRGFLVNLREVSRYDNTSIQLKNGEMVFLSKQKYNDFVITYMNYLRRT